MTFWGASSLSVTSNFLGKTSLLTSELFMMTGIFTAILILCWSHGMGWFNPSMGESKSSVEGFYSAFPLLFIFFAGIPALRGLITTVTTPCDFIVHTMANQWYWHYAYPELNLEFDSYMTPSDDLKFGEFRNLEVDNRLLLPSNTWIKMVFSSSDVIHSWAIPSLLVKADCVPGRESVLNMKTESPSVLYGQCSELCGVNHSFMPISLEIISHLSFNQWMKAWVEG